MLQEKGSRRVFIEYIYSIFDRSQCKRPIDPRKYKQLFEIMRRDGFCPNYPIECSIGEDGHLIVHDGQHRLAIAEELGLPVYWVEKEEDNWKTPEYHAIPTEWVPNDSVDMYAEQNLEDYLFDRDFARKYEKSICAAFAALEYAPSLRGVKAEIEENSKPGIPWPGVGAKKAYDAIRCLEGIPEDDPSRKRAYRILAEFLEVTQKLEKEKTEEEKKQEFNMRSRALNRQADAINCLKKASYPQYIKSAYESVLNYIRFNQEPQGDPQEDCRNEEMNEREKALKALRKRRVKESIEEAIDCLKRIPKNNPFREFAFRGVESFIVANWPVN